MLASPLDCVDSRRKSKKMRKILVADDSSTIRRIVEHALTATSTRVVQAADGLAAIEVARAEHPDLVLCDVSMPGLSGYEVADTLARDPKTSRIPVVLLAGAFERFDDARALRCGAAGRLDKPFEIAALHDAVERALSRAPRTEPETGVVRVLVTPSETAYPVTDAASRGQRTEADEPIEVEAVAEHPVADIDDEPIEIVESFDEPKGLPLASARVPLPGDDGFELTPRIPHVHLTNVGTSVKSADAQLDAAIEDAVRRRLETLAPDIVREIAWEIVPDLLERLVRESAEKRSRSREGSGESDQ